MKGGGAPSSFPAGIPSSDGSGTSLTHYKLNGVEGLYEVRVYDSPWSGNLTDIPLAITTFQMPRSTSPSV